MNWLYWAWFLLTTTALGIGSYFDLEERTIPDKVWVVQLVLALVLDTYWILEDPGIVQILIALSNVTFSFLIAIVAFITGSFGGADSKALMVLGLSTPIFPEISPVLWNVIVDFPNIFFVLLNFLLLMVMFALYNAFQNILSIPRFGPLFENTSGNYAKKVSILVSGKRVPSTDLDNMKNFEPAEKYDGEKWELYTPLFMEQMEDEEFDKWEKEMKEQAIKDIDRTGRKFIWIRPQPPGIVFLLISYIFLVLVGSPLGKIFTSFAV